MQTADAKPMMVPMARHTSVPVEASTPIRVTSRSGSVEITGEARADVLVESGADQVEPGPDGLDIAGRSGKIVARCPAGADVFVGCRSGTVTLHGAFGDSRVTTHSGSITVEQAKSVDARTASGSIVVDDCSGECRGQTKSGSIRVGRAGSADLAAASGSVEVGAVGAARVRAGSGTVTVGLTEPAPVDIEAHSGSVTVTVPDGVHPQFDLHTMSGEVRCDCESGTDGSIRVTARSGRISVLER